MNSLQSHEEAIRSQVCADCLIPTGSGICGRGHAEDCPLNTLLPRAIEAVRNGRSASIIEFFQALFDRNGSADTPITPREVQWLKDSLPLMTAAVREADKRMRRSA
ncbi:MAG TPA: hypothetical protein VJB38_11655 [Bacteroidota bacterium]|nr:hypothetical protein [Bacteroidota bacterium]